MSKKDGAGRCQRTPTCRYKLRGNALYDAFHNAEHDLNDGRVDNANGPYEVDWFDAGWNAREDELISLRTLVETARVYISTGSAMTRDVLIQRLAALEVEHD